MQLPKSINIKTVKKNSNENKNAIALKYNDCEYDFRYPHSNKITAKTESTIKLTTRTKKI